MPENTTPVTGQEWLGAKFPSLVGGRRGGLRHCLFAALLTVLALLVRLGWAPASAELQHLTFFPAVVVAAAVGGYRAGLLATGLGALAATYFFTPPYFAITADNLRLSFWANSVFAFDGIVVSLAIEAMHRYRDRYRSELVQSEAALAALNESQGRFRSLFEQMPDPAWLIRDEHFVEANAAALRALGLSSKPELLHLHPVDISPEFQPDGEASARKAAKQFEIVRRSGIHRFNWTHKRLDGTLLPVEVTLTQIQWDGRPAMYSVWRDMGDSQRAAENLRRAKQLMESVIQNIPAVVFLKRADDLRFELFNRAGEELLGYRAEQVLGKTDADLFPPQQADLFADSDRQALAAAETLDIPESVVATAQGELRCLYVRKTALRDAAGNATHLLGIAIDITERKQAEEEMRIAAVTFETDAAIMISDPGGNILRVNNAFQKITGYSAEEVAGKNPSILSSGRHDNVFYSEMWSRLLETGTWAGEIWDRRKSGQIYPKWLTITAVKNPAGATTGYVAIFTDITERKRAEAEIRNLAFYDPLTKLPNRRLLLDRFNQALANSARSRQYGAVLFLDMDKFKMLNDTLGHDYGDLMLIEVAKRIGFVVRGSDIVARLGGDEFVVLIEELGEDPLQASNKLIAVAEKIRAALAVAYHIENHVYHSSPSIGVSLFCGDGLSTGDILKRADIAMYQAKNSGRNTVRFYDPEMQQALETRAALEADLRQALAEGQLHLYYQIQIDSNGKPLGAEALIRWLHPQRGMVSPAQFIPVAEESSLILEIGAWVLDTACRQLAAWQQQEATRGLLLAINVSAHQFRQPDFVDAVSTAISAHNINVDRLKLELTESVIVDDVGEVVAKMHRLKALGVRLSLDDFGTGYSSLSYLKQMPLDQLKIDQSFVRDVVSDPNDAVLVKTIIDMANNFRFNVIAEGVETAAQHAFLKDNRCAAFQGYLFGKPLPIAEFKILLDSLPA
ncbi:EAL domain-containing protein [Methylomonas koyamae]|uniref:EAL domain-containing protein n=2 Tax=Methylomonas koyamae TaxID=702114 RepID=UPI001C33B0B8|nr:EAL domain-containing protein [Methylomonas koyamae]BBL60341.1 hypothetical protein MKFW12EY_39540 [Methylomonas koyamae]